MKGAETPTVTLARGINPVSLVLGLLALAFVAAILWAALNA